jgi:hypothetical protein
MQKSSEHRSKKSGKSRTSPLWLDNRQHVRRSSHWRMTAKEYPLRAFPDTATRDAEILVTWRVPREQGQNDPKWVRFSRHFCHQYCHRLADSKSLQWFIEKLTSNGQTAEQRAEAQCAVAYDSVGLPPQLRSLRDEDAARALALLATVRTAPSPRELGADATRCHEDHPTYHHAQDCSTRLPNRRTGVAPASPDARSWGTRLPAVSTGCRFRLFNVGSIILHLLRARPKTAVRMEDRGRGSGNGRSLVRPPIESVGPHNSRGRWP